MHEKTLLYAALAFTAVAAGFGVYKARESPATRTQISPVPLVDANRNSLLGADVPGIVRIPEVEQARSRSHA